MSRATAVLVVLLTVACSAPSPTAFPTVELAHFSGRTVFDTISFDYPANWRILPGGGLVLHYQDISVILGTGDTEPECQPDQPTDATLSGFPCGSDLATVGPGQIVVVISTWGKQGNLGKTPPPGAIRLPTGLLATVTDGPTNSTWVVYPTTQPDFPLTVHGEFRNPGAEQLRAAVKKLVESLSISRLPSETSTP